MTLEFIQPQLALPPLIIAALIAGGVGALSGGLGAFGKSRAAQQDKLRFDPLLDRIQNADTTSARLDRAGRSIGALNAARGLTGSTIGGGILAGEAGRIVSEDEARRQQLLAQVLSQNPNAGREGINPLLDTILGAVGGGVGGAGQVLGAGLGGGGPTDLLSVLSPEAATQSVDVGASLGSGGGGLDDSIVRSALTSQPDLRIPVPDIQSQVSLPFGRTTPSTQPLSAPAQDAFNQRTFPFLDLLPMFQGRGRNG